ncbi:MAG: formate/nitrite transporter family protein [Oscillospiraceae bacterium]|nr:formate/nitrite transporter family protein [Oscillospiraceae bacterium]
MEKIKTFVFAILAGAAIAIGGAAYLSVDSKILGAVLFTVGLFTVCSFGLNLYTGKVCYVFENKLSYTLDVVIIWIGNLVGTFLTAQAYLMTRIGAGMAAKAAELCAVKLGDGLLSIFILAIFCNVMIFIGVDGYKRIPHEVGKYLALFFGVVVFIICGFEHCVANMFYFSVAGAWSAKAFGYLIVMTLGNAVGGVIFPLLRMWKEKK